MALVDLTLSILEQEREKRGPEAPCRPRQTLRTSEWRLAKAVRRHAELLDSM
jgi:hypothetical protein